MAIAAKNTEVGKVYRSPGAPRLTESINYFYVRVDTKTAKALAKRLAAEGAHMRTDEGIELAAARDALAGSAVLFVRYMRGVDPMTKERWELRAYRALPLDYQLRELKRKPGYT